MRFHLVKIFLEHAGLAVVVEVQELEQMALVETVAEVVLEMQVQQLLEQPILEVVVVLNKTQEQLLLMVVQVQ
jgi:CTP:phosphocholine cytidylyltransferase-like protein